MLEYRTSFPAFGQVVSERYRKDARPVEPTSASAATPSPLNGERAGVRGEDTRDLPCNKLRCAQHVKRSETGIVPSFGPKVLRKFRFAKHSCLLAFIRGFGFVRG